jgi:hypothetical protein
MATIFRPSEVRQALDSIGPPSTDEPADYRIARPLGSAFLARARSGAPTLIVPLDHSTAGVGRRGGGFSLNLASRIAFDHASRRWEQPAATLECTEPRFLDAFVVLVADIATRAASTRGGAAWSELLEWVEEWQSLLGHRSILSAEQQLGLWGELWVISLAPETDVLIGGWRGPESEAVDFFLDGVGLEVKTSRRRHVHHISRRQAVLPVGAKPSYLLSLWIGIDPVKGVSLASLAASVLAQATDASDVLRRLSRLGYSPLDREQYETRWVLLEPPSFFRIDDVPAVRTVDAGVSELRYVVQLDGDKALSDDATAALWRHLRCRDRSSEF